MKAFLHGGLLATLLAASGAANAEWSTNLGYASEYHYRGIFQDESSASGGVDYESNGFYVGTWVADVGVGLEYDAYFGYGAEVGGVNLSIGYTGYFYTDDDFDNTYQEINLGAGFSIFSLDVAVGEYDDPAGTADYTYYSLTAEKNGFYGKVGGFAQDFEGEYVEAGYGTTLGGIDLGVAVILANKDLVGFQNDGKANESIVFSIGKAFDIE
ncbi:MAG: TorF family putative porin [Gammaproteobacteria bacterium]|nr:TorF family putative porin [Gammaproteobacteria bacterium]MDH3749524.1 TorF family putative porin [Gammaproteobacteria bacterium]MDH3804545.1 TorF family putative porin [Gammaproteobacteria bacterium]